ncbi:MAG: glutathione S-transferase family protein [Pseudomonadota bacterium]
MAEMTLYWSPQTRASRAVWLLEEAGADYALERVDIGEGASKSAAFLGASPMGKVPALRHGEVTVADSAAICAYVAETLPAAGLAPPVGDPRRGRYLQWLIYTPSAIEPAMSEKFSGSEPNRAQNSWGDFPTMIDVLRKGLGAGPWILGDQFSAADVMLGSSVVFMRMFGALPDHKDLHDYADRCLARPAYAKAMQMDSEAAG